MRNLTLSTWLDKFQHLREGEVAENTERNYISTCTYLREFFGEEKQLKRVTGADADDFRVFLRGKELALPTICSHLVRAETIFARAKLRELIRENPFAAISKTAPKPIKNWKRLTDEQVAAIVTAAPTPFLKRFIGLCAYAGLRAGEAKRILWDDVDKARRRLHVVPNSDYETTKQKSREVLLVPELEALLDLETDAEKDNPVCILGGIDLHRRMVGCSTAKGVFYPGILQKAGLEPFESPFHTLRRWRATSWRAQGYPEFAVDMWLGHGQAVARDYYVTVPEELYQKAP